MFVNELRIQEFRGIKSCNTPIKLSNFTVLIGRNNSGKSTLLEALSLLPSPTLNNYITNTKKINYLMHLHHANALKYLYAGNSILEYNLKEMMDVRFEIQDNKIDYLINNTHYSSNDYLIQFSRGFEVDRTQLSQLVLFIPYSTSILEDLEKRMRNLKELITKKGIHIELAKFLNECVNDKYSEIVFLEPISLRKVYDKNKVYLQLRDLGSGAEKVVKIMALLEVLSPKMVLLDDFEAGLHPSLIKLFLNWLKDKEWQTIISTHSIDVLYHLININPNDTTILQLNKSNEDILYHKILTFEQLEDFLNANTDPRLLVDALNL